MIPKIIHYIWLGKKPLPDLVIKCMQSWKKFCPDYEIKRWDETNLNLNINKYCKQAYELKKYAFASDVLRFDILNTYGGIYLDVDVEVLKPLDDLLENQCFMGFEMSSSINVAPGLIIGSCKNNKIMQNILNIYNNDTFIDNNGKLNYETVCTKTTKYLIENYKLKLENITQDFHDIKVYSTEYFCPINANTRKNIYQSERTYTKHLYLASWVSRKEKIKYKIINILKLIFGEKTINKILEKRKRNLNK